MRMKVSNYISEMLVKAGIHQAFIVTGGGAMHLDDALGHQEGLHCIYDHHAGTVCDFLIQYSGYDETWVKDINDNRGQALRAGL